MCRETRKLNKLARKIMFKQIESGFQVIKTLLKGIKIY